MGNCLKITTAAQKQGRKPQVKPEEGLAASDASGVAASDHGLTAAQEAAGGLKVKIVLTRGELEWLMMQLKNGEKRLEDVLDEMGKEREREEARAEGWKPRLESILEGSEVLCLD